MELTTIEEFGISLGDKIGSGAFGLVRRGMIDAKGQAVAVKLEDATQKRPLLPREAVLMQELQGGPGIPQVYGTGTLPTHHYLVLQLLDKSLFDRLRDCGGRLSLPTVIKCAEQILASFQFLHQSSIIHRDIKPENFLFSAHPDSHRLHVIDFGLSRKVTQGLLFKPYNSGIHQVVGTMPFVSVNIHLGSTASFRDDLESIAYLLVYLLQGGLPWYGLNIAKLTEKQTRESKQITNSFELCRDLPSEFEMLLKYAKSLTPEDIPDYNLLRKAFSALAFRLKIDLTEGILWVAEGKKGKRSKSERGKGTDKSEGASQASSYYPPSTKRGKKPALKGRKGARKRTLVQAFGGFNGHKDEIMGKVGGTEGDCGEGRKEEGLRTENDRQCMVF